MEQETIIIVSVFSVVSCLLLVLVAVLFSQVTSLRRRLEDLNASGRLRVQKLKLENDKNHAFHNPVISPDEELAKRGFSMYAKDDVESGRATPPPRQTGGQLLEELSRELDYRHKRQELQDEYEQQQDQLHYQHEQQSDYQQSRKRLADYQQSRQEQFHNNSRQQHHQQSSEENDYQQPRQRDDYHESRQPHNDRYSKQHPPPFLLQSIEENKRRSRQLVNPVANGRQSDTNPNFIY